MKLAFISKFLIRFFIIYIGFTFIYSQYLAYYSNSSLGICDPFTYKLTQQIEFVLGFLNYDIYSIPRFNSASIKLIFEGLFITEVIEGCNGISVMVLFLSLLFGFGGSILKTIVYSIFGISSLHLINIGRIALLNIIGFYGIPSIFDLFHDLVFPLIIYGYAFILIIFWLYFTFKSTKQ